MEVGADMIRRTDLQQIHIEWEASIVHVKDKRSTELGSSLNATMEAILGREYQSNQVLERAVWNVGGVPRTQYFVGADTI